MSSVLAVCPSVPPSLRPSLHFPILSSKGRWSMLWEAQCWSWGRGGARPAQGAFGLGCGDRSPSELCLESPPGDPKIQRVQVRPCLPEKRETR